MKGNLEPEEKVMEESIIVPSGWLGQLSLAIDKVFDRNDELEVVIGGGQVYEIEGDGTKWKPLKGTEKYNKDAFIVIRRPSEVVSSLPMDEFKPAHPYQEGTRWSEKGDPEDK